MGFRGEHFTSSSPLDLSYKEPKKFKGPELRNRLITLGLCLPNIAINILDNLLKRAEFFLTYLGPPRSHSTFAQTKVFRNLLLLFSYFGIPLLIQDYDVAFLTN